MASACPVSVSSVHRVWRSHGLQPHQIRQCGLSNDPQFAAKVRDVEPRGSPGIVGLYVNPPEHAVVLFAGREKPRPGARPHPARRTVASALNSVGLRGAATFTNHHRVPSHSRWSGQAAARCLLELRVAAFVLMGSKDQGMQHLP